MLLLSQEIDHRIEVDGKRELFSLRKHFERSFALGALEPLREYCDVLQRFLYERIIECAFVNGDFLPDCDMCGRNGKTFTGDPHVSVRDELGRAHPRAGGTHSAGDSIFPTS